MDSPLSLTAYSVSTTTGFTSGSTEHLSSQESLLSGRHRGDDNTSGVFSIIPTCDSLVPDVESESGSYHGEEDKDSESPKNSEGATSEAASVSSSDTQTAAVSDCAELEHADSEGPIGEVQDGTVELVVGSHPETKSLDSGKEERSEEQRDVSDVQCHTPSSSIGGHFYRNLYGLSKDSIKNDRPERSDHSLASSDDEDIYGHRIPHSSSDASVAEMAVSQELSRSVQEESTLQKSEQVLLD